MKKKARSTIESTCRMTDHFHLSEFTAGSTGGPWPSLVCARLPTAETLVVTLWPFFSFACPRPCTAFLRNEPFLNISYQNLKSLSWLHGLHASSAFSAALQHPSGVLPGFPLFLRLPDDLYTAYSSMARLSIYRSIPSFQYIGGIGLRFFGAFILILSCPFTLASHCCHALAPITLLNVSTSWQNSLIVL